ncbi:MAG: ATP-binding protein [Pseudomonadota bacterium]
MQAAPFGRKEKPPGGARSRLYKARFQSDNTSTRAALSDIRDAMAEASFKDDFIGRVEIVMAELFNNIAEHAYRDTGKGDVRCAIDISGSTMVVEVTDQGEPMPGGEVPDGTLPDIDVDFSDLPEGGFGWFLIRSQVDRLTYERQALGNCTYLTFDLTRAGIS